MPSEITMPQLSDTMTEGTLVKWHKKEGEKVKTGEEIADIETDKATMPMEAFESGTLAYIAVPEGQKVNVGERLAVIATGNEDPDEIKKQFSAGGKAASSKKSAEQKKAPEPASASGTDESAEEPTRTAARATPAGSAAGGRRRGTVGAASRSDMEIGHEPLQAGLDKSRRESVRDEPEHTSEQLSQEASAAISNKRRGDLEDAGYAAAKPRPRDDGGAVATLVPGDGERGRLRVSPLARRIAADRNIDLRQVRGSGPAGRIVHQDIVDYGLHGHEPHKHVKPQGPMPSPQQVIASGETQVIPLSKMRTAIAQRLQQSKQTVPHFYETVDADVEALSAMRQRLNKQLEPEGIRLSLGDFIAKAVAATLVRHPALNASFDGKQITRYGGVNLGMAVALPEGLIVPVLRGVERMGLRQIRTETADLVDRAREQRLKQDELRGATFTVSNLGTYGLREFSAIINPPEVAILAIAAAEKRAVVRGDSIVSRTMMSLTISADHRAVDGATAAEFMRDLKIMLEEPGGMLL